MVVGGNALHVGFVLASVAVYMCPSVLHHGNVTFLDYSFQIPPAIVASGHWLRDSRNCTPGKGMVLGFVLYSHGMEKFT